jgi:hypothetical protein
MILLQRSCCLYFVVVFIAFFFINELNLYLLFIFFFRTERKENRTKKIVLNVIQVLKPKHRKNEQIERNKTTRVNYDQFPQSVYHRGHF